MRNIYILVIALLLTVNSWAQAPQKMSYQAVIRNSSNALITSTSVGMKISILQGSSTGSVIYSETQTPSTNANGLVSIEIGNGTVVTGTFTAINWANGPYFIKTETDPTGGTAYTISGTSELLSVPYALHAKTAESITGGITETDPVFATSPANGITSSNITNWNNKLDTEIDGSVTNELQTLSISNDTIYLSNGGYTKLPAGFDGNYNNLTNKPTAVSSFSNDAGYLTSFTEVDGSITNELQTLSISNDTIYLSNGGYTKLPAGFDGNYNSLTNKPTAVSSFSNDAGYLTSFTEVDGSITNELQTLRISNDTIYLSNGGFAKIPATNAWNLNGNTGTVDGTNFIGTNDNVALNFKVNNQKAGRVDSNSDVFLGYQAGSNSTATENTAIGFQALQLTNNPLSLANTAIGYKALRANNGLGRNTAVGTHAMLNNTTGEWNTGIGAAAMQNNLTGSNNSALGDVALSSNQTGSGNISIGGASLMNNIAGSNGVAVGYGSQQNANNTTTPFDNTNTSIGFKSLKGSSTPSSNNGTNNTAIGREALSSNSSGSYNTATGYYSLFSNTSGMHNSAYGIYSLQSSTAGGYNTVMGSYAYRYNTTGNYNTIIGSQAGQSNTTGSRNVFIGYAAGYNEMGSNKLYIANDFTNPPLIYGDFANGNVGIGNNNPSARLHIGNGTRFVASADASIFLQSGNGVGSARDWKIYVPMTSGYLGFRDMGFDNLNNGMSADAMVIQSGTGNVGIGTTSPTTKFQVAGNAKFGATGQINIWEWDNIEKIGIDYNTVNGDFNMRNPIAGKRLLGTISTTGSWGVETTAGTELVRITGAGNMGIGNTSPTAKLQVENYGFSNKTIWGMNSMLIQNQTPGSRTLLALAPNGTQNADFVIYHNSDYTTNTEALSLGYENTLNNFIIGTSKTGTGSARGLVLDATGAGTNFWKQLVLATNGNVGIGTLTPSAALEVNGAIKVTGGTASQFLKADGSVDTNTYLIAIVEVADEFSATASQTSFTLTQAPSTNSKVKMYVNGVRISNTAYSVSGTTLTYVPANNGSYALTVNDRIQFDYSY